MRAATRKALSSLAVIVAVGGAEAAVADTPPPSARNFVSCPIVRDTATVPCWLAEHDGELYYLGIQTDISADFDPPYLGHRVLVEGSVAPGARICGGIVLDPVNVSPLPDLDSRCNAIWPAEERYTVPFAPRPPGPSGGRLAFEPALGAAPERPDAARDRLRTFEIHYDFDMLIMGRHAAVLTAILEEAQRIGARRITITGQAGATLLTDGTVMVEPATVALERAREVATLLEQAGLRDVIYDVQEAPPAPPDGVEDWRSRRAVVVVED
jgi:hypothetical protein